MIYSTNLARAPGFEGVSELYGEYWNGSQVEIGNAGFPNGSGSVADSAVEFWNQNLGSSFSSPPLYSGNWWSVSTANPRTGTQHARTTKLQTSNFDEMRLYGAGLTACEDPYGGSRVYQVAGGRVDPGDTVDVSAWVEDTSAGGAGTWTLAVDWWANGAFQLISSQDFSDQPTYAQISASFTDTSGNGDIDYFRVWISADLTKGAVNDTWDIDDVSWSVS